MVVYHQLHSLSDSQIPLLGLGFLFLTDDATVLMKDILDTLRELRATTISRPNDGDVLGLMLRLHATFRHEIGRIRASSVAGYFDSAKSRGTGLSTKIWGAHQGWRKYHVKPTTGTTIRDIVGQRRGRHWMSTTTEKTKIPASSPLAWGDGKGGSEVRRWIRTGAGHQEEEDLLRDRTRLDQSMRSPFFANAEYTRLRGLDPRAFRRPERGSRVEAALAGRDQGGDEVFPLR